MSRYQKNGHTQEFLSPGQVIFTQRPTVVTTILGSCVSVTMFHKPTMSAGICHAQFARAKTPADTTNYYYTDSAVLHMADYFSKKGFFPREIEVKMFGGGDVLDIIRPFPEGTVGRMNIISATETLLSLGYSIYKQDVGGTLGRRLYFETDTGTVYVKKVHKTTLVAQ